MRHNPRLEISWVSIPRAAFSSQDYNSARSGRLSATHRSGKYTWSSCTNQ